MPAASTRPHAFPPTRWTLVMRAGSDATEPARRHALGELCQAYWYPLYAFARGRGATPHDAEDQTQGFFASIVDTDFFTEVEAERGKLRSYLLAAFSHFIANTHRAARTQKRGGGQPHLSVDLELAEGRLRNEPACDTTLEGLYEKRWALALVQTATAALEASYHERGKAGHFSALKCFLEGTDDDTSYATAAQALGLHVTAVRQEVYRMRIKFRDLVRDAIAHTLDSPTEAELEAELMELKRVLSAA